MNSSRRLFRPAGNELPEDIPRAKAGRCASQSERGGKRREKERERERERESGKLASCGVEKDRPGKVEVRINERNRMNF